MAEALGTLHAADSTNKSRRKWSASRSGCFTLGERVACTGPHTRSLSCEGKKVLKSNPEPSIVQRVA
jgi:hypothetical protein